MLGPLPRRGSRLSHPNTALALGTHNITGTWLICEIAAAALDVRRDLRHSSIDTVSLHTKVGVGQSWCDSGTDRARDR